MVSGGEEKIPRTAGFAIEEYISASIINVRLVSFSASEHCFGRCATLES